MKLIVKFNLVFILVFVLGLAAAGYVSQELLQRNAREEVVHSARLVMESALATRAYTSSQVAPLLQTQMKYTFLPQSVPAYSATEVFNTLRKNFPDYAYKEATLNPTNPAQPRERLGSRHRQPVPQCSRRPGNRRASAIRRTGRSFYIARPDPDQAGALPRLPFDGGRGAQDAGRQVRPGQRLRLEAERGDRRAGRIGADRGCRSRAPTRRSGRSWCR